MIKLKNIIIIILSLFIICGCFKSDEERRQEKVNKILTYMENKYGEKFYMSSPFGGRGTNDDLRIMVKPVRYKGTPKEEDHFYEDYAFIKTDGEVGDGFGTVYLKEGAEEYFKPKLKELFGENILIAIEPKGYYEKWNFKEEMSRRKKVYDDYPEGRYSPLSGGIYIFGRVENEADREHYRKQIYEFIQYLKSEGMFDYTEITLHVVDERFLTKEAVTLKIKQKIIDNYKAYTSRKYDLKTYINRRKAIYSEIGENYIVVQEELNNFLKNSESSDQKALFYGSLIFSNIYSEKSIQTNYFLKDQKIKKYDKIEDVSLSGDNIK